MTKRATWNVGIKAQTSTTANNKKQTARHGTTRYWQRRWNQEKSTHPFFKEVLNLLICSPYHSIAHASSRTLTFRPFNFARQCYCIFYTLPFYFIFCRTKFHAVRARERFYEIEKNVYERTRYTLCLFSKTREEKIPNQILHWNALCFVIFFSFFLLLLLLTTNF